MQACQAYGNSERKEGTPEARPHGKAVSPKKSPRFRMVRNNLTHIYCNSTHFTLNFFRLGLTLLPFCRTMMIQVHIPVGKATAGDTDCCREVVETP